MARGWQLEVTESRMEMVTGDIAADDITGDDNHGWQMWLSDDNWQSELTFRLVHMII